MKYEKLSPSEVDSFMRGYQRAEEIAKMFCSKYGSIYTYYELKILPFESCFRFRVGSSTPGIKLYTPVDYVSLPFYTLMEDGEHLDTILDYRVEKFKQRIEDEKKRQESLRCDKCGRPNNTPCDFVGGYEWLT